MEILCERLKQLRKEKGLTQKDVGKVLGVKNGAISYYESGRNLPSIEDLAKLANEYDKSLDYFVGHDHQILSDNSDDYNISMCSEEVRFIKAIRNDARLYSDLIDNPENLVNRMKIKL